MDPEQQRKALVILTTGHWGSKEEGIVGSGTAEAKAPKHENMNDYTFGKLRGLAAQAGEKGLGAVAHQLVRALKSPGASSCHHQGAV